VPSFKRNLADPALNGLMPCLFLNGHFKRRLDPAATTAPRLLGLKAWWVKSHGFG